jgi:peptidoglycan-N-acetylglucosamine deacetylase
MGITQEWERIVLAPARQRRERASVVRRKRKRNMRMALIAIAGAVLVAAIFLGAKFGPFAGASGSGKANGPHQSWAGSPPPRPNEKQLDLQAVNTTLSYTQFVREGTGKAPEVALTFDDGPSPDTPKILKILNNWHAQATFFEIGREIPTFHAYSSELEKAGMVIGNHTYDHVQMAEQTDEVQSSELTSQSDALDRYGIQHPVLFRPPYGSFNEETFSLLKQFHMLMVLWSTDTDDYTDPGVQSIVNTALKGIHPGSIVLFHDGGGDRAQTVAALPKVLAGLEKRHLRPVTVPRLLADDPPAREQTFPQDLSGR